MNQPLDLIETFHPGSGLPYGLTYEGSHAPYASFANTNDRDSFLRCLAKSRIVSVIHPHRQPAQS